MSVLAHDLNAKLMVGMEVHVELATRSKMFTSAPNVAHPEYFDASPNSLTDPVVLGMPGVLPVVNRQAVEMAIRVGLALGCKIAKVTKWDRKSYYYPDLPKNYQISQYDQPLCYDGQVQVPAGADDGPDAPLKTIRILRAHLEEDAGKLLHEAPGGGAIDHSIVDLNRSGTPLLEIVTHPDFDHPDQVIAFAQMLRDICRHLGVSEGILQKGHMRFEPNINVVIQRDGKTYKTPIVEIKNLNSFKALDSSVRYEFERQIEEWTETGKVMAPGSKSTRGWDDASGSTFLQREKEDAHDYRYFPDPDLVPLTFEDAWLEKLRAALPELPRDKERRWVKELGLPLKETRQIMAEPSMCAFFEKVLDQGVEPRRAMALLLNNLARRANERNCGVHELGIHPAQIKAIEAMTAGGRISAAAADELIGMCCQADPVAPPLDPAKLAEEKGLIQVSDDAALGQWIDQALAANPKSVEAIKAGKEAAMGPIVGAVMKLSKGKANPKAVSALIRSKVLGA